LVHMCSFCRHWTWSLTARASLWLQRSHNNDHMRQHPYAGHCRSIWEECHGMSNNITIYYIIYHHITS
jgi:hypothetical protein